MSKANNNVPIASLLDSGNVKSEAYQDNSLGSVDQASASLQYMVSNFQTTVDVSPSTTVRSSNVITSPIEVSRRLNNSNLKDLINKEDTEQDGTLGSSKMQIESTTGTSSGRPPSEQPQNTSGQGDIINLIHNNQERKTSSVVSENIKKFQTSFVMSELDSVNSSPTPSKTSINSLINSYDDSENNAPIEEVASNSTTKKRKAPPKKKKTTGEQNEPANKRKKADNEVTAETTPGQTSSKASTPAAASAGDEKKKPNEETKKRKPAKARQTDAKTTKKSTKTKKKASDDNQTQYTTISTASLLSNPVIRPTMTTDRMDDPPDSSNSISPPEIIEIAPSDKNQNETKPNEESNGDSDKTSTSILTKARSDTPAVENQKSDSQTPKDQTGNEKTDTEKAKEKEKENEKVKEREKEREKEKEKENTQPPIIALNVPLLDPKKPMPGRAEVVVNVLRLAEEKYGWSVIHPSAESAIDLMDDLIDDDEDGLDDEEDDEVLDDEEKTNKKKKEEEQLTEEQLVRRHEAKMNRKVGKYDYEDPFIDDEELQMEEIASTKEGFFVYWGPLVDDRSSANSGSKKGSKTKK